MSEELTTPTPPRKPSLVERVGTGRIVALGVCTLLLVSLAFAPVRAIASQMLGVFRVQKVKTIAVTQADIEQISKVFSEGEGKVSLESLGDVSVEGGNAEPTQTTLEAAQAAVDFNIEAASGLDATPVVMLQKPITVKFKLHADKVNELLESYGATKTLSKSVDGKEFEIRMPATVALAYPDKLAANNAAPGDPGSVEGPFFGPDPTAGLVVVQTRGPQLIVPDGVNPLEIRDVLLGLPILPDNIRSQLASIQDWQSTLLIPSVNGSSREISVNGMPGVVIGTPDVPSEMQSPDQPAPEDLPVVVMWNDNGVTRAVGGMGGEARIVKIAESVGR
jgi:hypothetical protein